MIRRRSRDRRDARWLVPVRSPRYDVSFYAPGASALVADPPSATGGAEVQVLLVAKTLAARGAKVCVVVADIDGAAVPDRVDDVDVVVRPPHVPGRGLRGRLREILLVERALARAPARTIVARSAGFSVGLTAFHARLRRRRFVYSSANVADFDPKKLALPRRDRLLFRAGVLLANALVVQTEEQRVLCRDRFGRDARVAPSIVVLPPVAGELSRSSFLWAGRAVWYKRPLDYVALAQAMPEARFRMVLMPGRRGEDLSDTIRAAAVDVPNLELLPSRPRVELAALFDEAIAVVNTSEFEGLPNVTLEGWGRGVPVLTLFHDPDGVVVQHGLGLHADGSLEQLAVNARYLWSTPTEARALGARCRSYVAQAHAPDVAARVWEEAVGLVEEPGLRPVGRTA